VACPCVPSTSLGVMTSETSYAAVPVAEGGLGTSTSVALAMIFHWAALRAFVPHRIFTASWLVPYRPRLKGGPVLSWMPSFKKRDLEPPPIGRHCPACTARMMTVDITPGPEGFELRTFECVQCGRTDKTVRASDPLKSNAIGWLASELKPPA